MARALLFVVILARLPVAYSQEKPKDREGPSPGEVVKSWNEAAAKRDIKFLAKLASKDVTKQVLEAIEQQGFLHYRGETKVIHEEISGTQAVVVFRVEHRGAVFTAEIRYGMALLLREDGAWKFARDEGSVTLKPGKR
ncbi:MAG: nuclear transport factor 2 family protein [Gemmataceae bacterium]|nr:nuclear transport factor 2 family protein [Gemmataceae bacterium]